MQPQTPYNGYNQLPTPEPPVQPAPPLPQPGSFGVPGAQPGGPVPTGVPGMAQMPGQPPLNDVPGQPRQASAPLRPPVPGHSGAAPHPTHPEAPENWVQKTEKVIQATLQNPRNRMNQIAALKQQYQSEVLGFQAKKEK